LYTSIGFRVELTQLMAEEISMTVDIEEFEKRMQGFECCCSSSNKSGGNSGKEKRLVADQTLALVNAGVAATDDSAQHFTEELIGCKASALFIGRGTKLNLQNLKLSKKLITSPLTMGLLLLFSIVHSTSTIPLPRHRSSLSSAFTIFTIVCIYYFAALLLLTHSLSINHVL
jgi:hypothetical protein